MPSEESRSVCQFLEMAATDYGDRAAVITDTESVSYEHLATRARQAAAVLCGTEADKPRIALLAENDVDYVVLYWAILLAGGVTVELNPGLGDADLETQLQNAACQFLIAAPHFAPRVERPGFTPSGTDVLVACLQGCVDTDDLAARLTRAVKGEVEEHQAPASSPPSAEALASIVYTSGTTGQVKGVCLTHQNLAWVTGAIAESFSLKRGDPRERFSGNLPLFYTYGKSVLHLATWLGAPIVFTRRALSPRNLLEVVGEARVTHLSLVPYYCNLLLRLSGFSAQELPELRRVTIAGGALHAEARGEMLRRFPGRVIPMYGLTEASTRVACMPAGEAEKRPDSCGRAIPGVEIRIAGESGRSLACGEEGEVLVRGPNVMRGYCGEAGSAAFLGEWLRTGDIGHLDRDGYLTITGRSKDVIKVMGESVSALSVEGVVAALPGVADVAVKGVPDSTTGEAICVFVTRRPGADLSAEEIRRECARTLGRSRVPAHVRFVDELPRTASGKVCKNLLTFDA